ncbi:MAG TPA: DUF5715 family protein [Longimicrobiales bacterium]
MTLRNRIGISSMGQYSSGAGFVSDGRVVCLGVVAAGGAGSARGGRFAIALAAAIAAAAVTGCVERREPAARESIDATLRARVERVLEWNGHRIDRRAEAIDEIFQPLPLLTAAEESALRRYGNDAHLARARRLGVPRPSSEAEVDSLRAAGRLVELAAETRHWVVRELDHSLPYVTPDVVALLEEIGERFHARLAELGVPPYRLEITSVLRTAAAQRDLRRTNANAARGVSAHEYGTTVDVAYSAYAAPSDPIVPIDAAGARWLERPLETYARARAELVAARRSRELQAILGDVLRELQAEGKVRVTLERRQPVYHLTVATRFDDDA